MGSTSSVFISFIIFVFMPNYCQSQGDGIEISLRGRVIPNHGLVAAQDIGVDTNGMNLAMGLKCSTIYTQGCCQDFTPSIETRTGQYRSGTGSWLNAHSETHPCIPRQVDTFDHTFGIRRSGSAVYVFRNKDSAPYITDGIWRCVIPDSNGNEQTKYIGVYSNSNNGTVHQALTTLDTIQYTLLNSNPVMFSLTFRTTGGPATNVTWTRDGVNISGDNRYTPSQNVIPNGNGLYTAGNYDNILTVNGRLSGVYGVSVTNNRTTTPATPNITIIIDYLQPVLTSGSAIQSADGRSVTVTWTVSNSSLVTRYFNGYEIQTRRCPLGQQTTGCDDLQMVQTTSTQYTLTDVPLWVTYEFSIALINMSNHNFHHFLPGISGLDLRGIQISIFGILPPEITSVIELANITSVQVTWNQPVGGLTVDEYVVSYRRLNGRDGQCSSFQDEGNVTVSAMEEGVDHTAILHLQAYSVYTCTVTVRNLSSGLYNETTINISTNETVPSKAPQNLAVCIYSPSTSVTISWDSVECIHRNGMITHYIISYGLVGNTNLMTARVNATDQDDGGSYTADGVDHTNCIFKVAAVNEAGVGVFANVSTNPGPMIVSTVAVPPTNQTSNSSTLTATIAGMASGIVISVLFNAVLLGVIIVLVCWICRTRRLSLPQAINKQQCSQGEGSEAQRKQKETFYEEINIPSKSTKTAAMEMDTCPAYI